MNAIRLMNHTHFASKETTCPTGTNDPIPVVGIGPGNPAYLTSKALDIIKTSEVLVGFESVIGYIEEFTSAELLKCSYKTEATTLKSFATALSEGKHGAAVLMGDPNVSGHQFIEKIESAIDLPIEIIPGISSIQIAASRSRIALENSTVVTLHKRGPLTDDLSHLSDSLGERHIIILPRPYDWMPEHIANYLVSTTDCRQLQTLVLEQLTLPDESVTQTSLGVLAEEYTDDDDFQSAFTDLTVMVISACPSESSLTP